MASAGGGAYRHAANYLSVSAETLLTPLAVTLSPSSPRVGSSYRLNMLWPQSHQEQRVSVSRVGWHVYFCTTCPLMSRFKASNGIVIATEKKSSSILIDDSVIEKVAVICPNIGIVYSGMGPDFRVLVTRARKSAQAYWKVYGEYPPTKVLTQEIANIMQQATHSGSDI